MPFEKLVVPPLSENLSKSELDKLGLFLEDNTEDEIFQTVKEFLEQKDQTPTNFKETQKLECLNSGAALDHLATSVM